MMDGMGEVLSEALGFGATEGPRWLRVVITAMLLFVALALLTLVLWWPR